MQRKQTMFLVQGAVIAALYAALTYAAGLLNLAYGSVQFRFSEALTVLAVFTPAAIPGLTIGCFLGNLGSPYGMIDIVCGTLATLLAAGCSYLTRKIRFKNLPILSLFFPVLFNALIVGAEIAAFLPEGFTMTGYLINALWVGLGELVVCYVGGIPLFLAVEKTPLAKKMQFVKTK
ncbi:MAG: QueT transporter family protein [Candidatus Fimenecus sp.]